MMESSEDGVVDFGRVRGSSGVRGGDVEGLADIGEEAGERGKQGEQWRNKAKQKETTTNWSSTNTTMRPGPGHHPISGNYSPGSCLMPPNAVTGQLLLPPPIFPGASQRDTSCYLQLAAYSSYHPNNIIPPLKAHFLVQATVLINTPQVQHSTSPERHSMTSEWGQLERAEVHTCAHLGWRCF